MSMSRCFPLRVRGIGTAPLPVAAAPVKRGDIVRAFTLPGTVTPLQQANVTSVVSGTVERVTAHIGERVAAGQLLVKIDDSTLRAQLQQNEAELAVAKANLAQATAQAAGNVQTTDASLEAARVAYRTAETSVQRDRQLLAQGYIAQSTVDDAAQQAAAAEAQLQTAEINVALAVFVVVGALSRRVDARLFCCLGFAVLAFSSRELATMTDQTDEWTFVMDYVAFSGGLALLFGPVTALGMSTLDADQKREASALFNFIRYLGGTLGIGALNAFLDRRARPARFAGLAASDDRGLRRRIFDPRAFVRHRRSGGTLGAFYCRPPPHRPRRRTQRRVRRAHRGRGA